MKRIICWLKGHAELRLEKIKGILWVYTCSRCGGHVIGIQKKFKG